MTRLYGRALTDERINEFTPDVRFKRVSVISSIRLNGAQAPMVFQGTLNGEFFAEYIKESLAPTLSQGDIVIMDNLSSHKVAKALDPIYAKKASVLFLPPYSPDLNPIELSWSKMKSVLKKLKARTPEELFKSMKIALESFTSSDLENWFIYDGYNVDKQKANS